MYAERNFFMKRKIIAAALSAFFMLGLTVNCFARQNEPLSYLSDAGSRNISVSASAAILIEADTKTVLYAKNEKEHRSIASTTKIMTALLTLEAGELDKRFTVDSEAIMVEGTSMGLKKGDIVTRRALCCGMMLPSGNDAANAAAVSVSGSIAEFSRLMNSRAEMLGMKDTNFVTPSGLDANGQYSCAYDLALLTAKAMENEDFAEICAQTKMKVSFGNPPYDRWLVNSNKLLYSYDGCIGVKTGFTDDAGRTLVSAAERDGVRLIAVTLNAPNDWQDHAKMLDYGFARVQQSDISYNCSGLSVAVVGADKDFISLKCETVSLPLCEEQRKSITARVYLPRFVYAGITAGEQIGEVRFELNGAVLATARLTAAESCAQLNDKPDFFTMLITVIRRFFSFG